MKKIFTIEDLKKAFEDGRLYEAGELELDTEGGKIGRTFDAWLKQTIVIESSKEEKIDKIKDILEEVGSTSTGELEAQTSPVINSMGEAHVLAERFHPNCVDIVSYVGSMDVGEDSIPYEDLTEDVIDEILELLRDHPDWTGDIGEERVL